MKLKVLVSALLLFGLFLMPVMSEGFGVAQAGHGDMLATVLGNIETTNRTMTGLQAVITHQHTNTQLDIKDVKQVGTLIYKPGAVRRIRIDYTQPQQKVVAVNGDRAILFERELNQVFLSTVSKFTARNASYNLLAVLSSAAQLKEKFNITMVGDENMGGQVTTHLTLTPKTQDISYTRIEAWIDHKTWLPVRQIFYERNRDYTEVTLSNVVLNPSRLLDKQFEVDYGKAKVIRQ